MEKFKTKKQWLIFFNYGNFKRLSVIILILSTNDERF